MYLLSNNTASEITINYTVERLMTSGWIVCIGMHLAKMELRLAAALFFRAFPNARVSGLEGMSDGDMDEAIYFLLAPKGKRCLLEAS